MTSINSAVLSQQQTLTLSRTVEQSYERSAQVFGARASVGGREVLPADPFQRIFDLIDISEEAQSQLRRDRAFADALAGIRSGVGRGQVLNRGGISIDLAAIGATERFSFSETYELSFLQESTLSIETDNGSFEVTQTRLVEVSLSASIEFNRSSGAFGLRGSLTV